LFLVAALFAAVSLPALHAQQQEPPKEKKKPRKVWTEDDLAGLGGRINVVGTEAPPPPPAGLPAAAAPTGDTALWEELDMLTGQRQAAQEQLDLNRRHLESINAKLDEESDALNIDELLQGRATKEEEILRLEGELESLNQQVAALEKQLAGRKRPARTRAQPPVPAKERPPAAEGEEPAEETPAEEPPKEEPPAEEEPPPPPPAF
jgi:hypothetical protein